MGSFSLISSPHLVRMAKNIGSQAASYGFQLALKTYAPQIESLLKDLRNLAMDLNQFGVEDCNLVKSLYASALSEKSAMYETACRDLKRGGSKDYFSARLACGESARAREAAQQFQAQSKEEVLLDNFNLLIVAARKAQVPENMLENTLGIAGTLIVKDGQATSFDSLILDNDTFNAHLKGGTASVYTCPDTPCIHMTKVENQEIAVDTSFQGKASTKLREIKSKMLDDVGFAQGEIDFLNSLGETFPIYNYLSLEAVTGLSVLDKSADLAAGYMLIHYLGNIISEVRVSIQALEGGQFNKSDFMEYLSSLNRVQDFLHDKYKDLMERAYRTEKKAQYIEKHFMAKLR